MKLTALPLCADAAKQQVQTAMAKIKQKQFDYNAQEGRALEEPSGMPRSAFSGTSSSAECDWIGRNVKRSSSLQVQC